MDRLRVATHAPDPLTQAGITSWLRASPELQVLSDQDDAEAAVLVVVADVVTQDLLAALARTGDVRTRRIVLIAQHIGERDLPTAVATGVVAALPRAAAKADVLVRTVVQAARTTPGATTEILVALRAQAERVNRATRSPRGPDGTSLTNREVELLRLLAAGWATAEIAAELSYSERTVKNMVHRLLNRLKLRNRAHAVAYAVRTGVI